MRSSAAAVDTRAPCPPHPPPPHYAHTLPQLVAPDSLESQFRALEGGAVDDDLAELKAALQLGSGSSKQPVGQVSHSGGEKKKQIHGSDTELRRAKRVGVFAAFSWLHLAHIRPAPAARFPQLPPGRPLADALEYELQDLKRKQQQSD